MSATHTRRAPPRASVPEAQPRWGWLTARWLGAVALAAITFVMLAISENRPLFGFQEPGYDPAAIAASRVAEVATVVLLGGYLVARFAIRVNIRRW